MTTENSTPPENLELVRLREHSQQLLAELKAERTAHKATQDALEATQGAETAWRARWHETAVLAPLETDLRGAAAGPWRYLKDTCAELGLLKMLPDTEGVERPAWFDEKGKPADLTDGVYKFLCGVAERTTGNDLGHCLRSGGARGGGATGSTGTITPAKAAAAPTPTPPATFGLR